MGSNKEGKSSKMKGINRTHSPVGAAANDIGSNSQPLAASAAHSVALQYSLHLQVSSHCSS